MKKFVIYIIEKYGNFGTKEDFDIIFIKLSSLYDHLAKEGMFSCDGISYDKISYEIFDDYYQQLDLVKWLTGDDTCIEISADLWQDVYDYFQNSNK